MEVDISNEENRNSSESMENGHLEPVPHDSSGEGLPYAPENFPNEGDNWRWRVGKRVATTGHYQDRYIYPPKKYKHFEKELSMKHGIGSKLSLKRFVETAFPKADVDAFFASFSWKVPSKKFKPGGSVERPIPFHEETPKEAAPDSSTLGCKAHNKMCSSLAVEDKPTVATMVCDICCIEPGFCRDCCCILCCKMIDTAYEGYSYIKCEALFSEDCICGHVAHLECAIRAYMAGTVGGSIGLDAEYYCRRCDAKTELTPHVAKLLQTCKSIDSRDDLLKVLNVGVCVLRGSNKASAKALMARLYRILTKVKSGSAFEKIWEEDNESAAENGISNGDYKSPGQEDEQGADGQEVSTPSKSTVDSRIQFLQLDNEIDKTLQALKAAQELEYKIAEERFHTQKDYLHNLYQQLEHESSELRKRRLSPSADELMDAVSERKDQIHREFKKLKQMKEVAINGFAKTSKDILREHFGMESC